MSQFEVEDVVDRQTGQVRRDIQPAEGSRFSVKDYTSEGCGKRAAAMYSLIVTCRMTIFANLIRRVLLRCGRDHQVRRRRGRRLQMVFKKPHLIDADPLREFRLVELVPEQLLVC